MKRAPQTEGFPYYVFTGADGVVRIFLTGKAQVTIFGANGALTLGVAPGDPTMALYEGQGCEIARVLGCLALEADGSARGWLARDEPRRLQWFSAPASAKRPKRTLVSKSATAAP